MRNLQGFGLLLFIGVVLLIEYYSISALRFSVKNIKPIYRYTIITLYVVVMLLWLGILFGIPYLRTADMSKELKNTLVSFSMGFLIMKTIAALILLVDDVRRFFYWLVSYLPNVSADNMSVVNGMSRSEFMNKAALLISGSLFGTMLLGMANRYNYKVRQVQLKFPNLPPAFDGLKIVQISDVHSGSFNNKLAVNKGIQQILDLNPDVIFFTGDLVNNTADEVMPYIDVFSNLTAPLGVYSILGNHDYGDYHQWDSAEEKEENLAILKNAQKKMGWNLLLNEAVTLQKGDDTISLIGVENTSFKNRFKSYGDLSKAYAQAKDSSFKILLSHDPSHWDGEVNTKYKDIDLTLSGHTHGFQFGVEIPWLKWSPVQYVYKQWAGLYQKDSQYLYVNRGFGFIGYPGRVGIMPEITLLELRS